MRLRLSLKLFNTHPVYCKGLDNKQQLGVIFNRFTAIIANDLNSNISIWIIRYYIAAFFRGQGMESELIIR